MPQAGLEQAIVTAKDVLAPDILRLELESPSTAQAAWPGQFVMVRTAPGLDPLLKRPFSIHDRLGGKISLLFKVVGRGTQRLSDVRIGEGLEILGPLGQGFPFPAGPKLLVAGGLGAAPLLFAARRLKEQGVKNFKIRLGARTGGELAALNLFGLLGLEAETFTEDGSTGRQGLVTAGLAEELKSLGREAAVLACGPEAMLKAVAQAAKEGETACFLSLERRMACGLGACLGCVVRDGRGGFLRVCLEGPVFSAGQVEL